MAWYKLGTVGVTLNSTAVTGTGTAWLSNAATGDGFVGPDLNLYEILTVNSDTSITLARAYGSTTVTSGGVYAIQPTHDYNREQAKQLATLISKYNSIATSVGSAVGVVDDPTLSSGNVTIPGPATGQTITRTTNTQRAFTAGTYQFTTNFNSAGAVVSIGPWVKIA